MSAITFEQVKHLAELARIEMTHDELTAMATELDIIVSSVENLSEIVTSDTPATSHPIPLTNVFREDVVGKPSPKKRRSRAHPMRRTASSACPQSSTKTKGK